MSESGRLTASPLCRAVAIVGVVRIAEDVLIEAVLVHKQAHDIALEVVLMVSLIVDPISGIQS